MNQKRPAVFFDRDGVLNVDHGYTYREQDFEWMAGAIETIKYFNARNYRVFVITNQSGVARGYYTEHDVQLLHQFMNEELDKQGAHIDAFYYCPHHSEGKVEEYRQSCTCRKPKPEMIHRAIKEWAVDSAHSFMIGDKSSDIEAANAAGLTGYLFTGGNLYKFTEEQILPYIHVKNIS
ncbi:MAG: gmhB [Pelosinus sp.]|jgi:D-glycero-D-manno-heptose 1,7-bisphosphate phosphatase|nr:gmhB [Pelosinus sp.]